jgi:hypothetical protein
MVTVVLGIVSVEVIIRLISNRVNRLRVFLHSLSGQ